MSSPLVLDCSRRQAGLARRNARRILLFLHSCQLPLAFPGRSALGIRLRVARNVYRTVLEILSNRRHGLLPGVRIPDQLGECVGDVVRLDDLCQKTHSGYVEWVLHSVTHLLESDLEGVSHLYGVYTRCHLGCSLPMLEGGTRRGGLFRTASLEYVACMLGVVELRDGFCLGNFEGFLAVLREKFSWSTRHRLGLIHEKA
jgi:hypothetical protein